MCKDKYYTLVGYALSKLANLARTSMLHFLTIFQELSYLVTPASSLVRCCDMRGVLQLFFTSHNILPALFDVWWQCVQSMHCIILQILTRNTVSLTHHQEWRRLRYLLDNQPSNPIMMGTSPHFLAARNSRNSSEEVEECCVHVSRPDQ